MHHDKPTNWLLRVGLVLFFGPIVAVMLFAAVLMCSLGWAGVTVVVGMTSLGTGLFLIYRGIEWVQTASLRCSVPDPPPRPLTPSSPHHETH